MKLHGSIHTLALSLRHTQTLTHKLELLVAGLVYRVANEKWFQIAGSFRSQVQI